MRIGLNQQIQFPEITHGRIYSDKYNVYCDSAKITINGEQNERMLELKSVTITMSEIDIEVFPNKIVDLHDNVKLELKCFLGIDTYLILEKPDRCQLAKIRSLTVNQVQLTHKGKREPYLINEEHKIILRKIDKQLSEECDLIYFTTDYPELMIVPDSQENIVKLLEMSTHADSINVDLELRISEEFLHFQMEKMMQSTVHEVQQHL